MRFIRITNKQKYHNMPSGAILHKHRTKREDSSRWHIMIHPSIVAVLLIGTIYTIIVYTCHNVNASNSVSFTVDNSDTVLELTLPSSVTLDLVPSSTNNYVSFGTSDLSILAGTNNPYGLTLTMSVPNTNLTNSSLTITNDNTNNPNNIPLDSSNHPIIPTLSSGTTYTENTFTTNSWGYKLSTNTNYSSVPSSLELLNTDSASNAITTTLNLAAKVDSTRPAGVYSAVLNFAMVGNAALIIENGDFLLDDMNSLLAGCSTSTCTYQTGQNIDDNFIVSSYAMERLDQETGKTVYFTFNGSVVSMNSDDITETKDINLGATIYSVNNVRSLSELAVTQAEPSATPATKVDTMVARNSAAARLTAVAGAYYGLKISTYHSGAYGVLVTYIRGGEGTFSTLYDLSTGTVADSSRGNSTDNCTLRINLYYGGSYLAGYYGRYSSGVCN